MVLIIVTNTDANYDDDDDTDDDDDNDNDMMVMKMDAQIKEVLEMWVSCQPWVCIVVRRGKCEAEAGEDYASTRGGVRGQNDA